MRAILRYFTTPDEPSFLRWVLLVFLALVPLYVYAAGSHAKKFNHGGSLEPGDPPTYYLNDQKVYLRAAGDIHEEGLSYISPRQRTTGYAFFLAPFYDKKLEPEAGTEPITLEWFSRAKTVNIWLSVLLLATLGIFYALSLSPFLACAALTITAFALFVFRAGYTQPELLYWTLNSILFFLLWRLLLKPGWILAAICGVLAGVAFFVKAGTLPLIYLFIATFGFKMAWDWLVLKKGWSWKTFAQGALVPVLFFVTLSPYFTYSWKTFGSPFYSTYSKYIMWGEEKDEMYAIMTAGAGDQKITDDDFQREYAKHYLKRHKDADPASVPKRSLPSAKRYFSNNDFSVATERISNGIGASKKRMKKYYRDGWKFLQWMFRTALVCAIVAGALSFARNPRALGKGILEGVPVFLYGIGFFLGYLILYSWYDALGIGVRLMLSLYIPALFTLLWIIDRCGRHISLPLGDKGRLYLGKVISPILLVYALTKAHRVLTENLYLHYSGA